MTATLPPLATASLPSLLSRWLHLWSQHHGFCTLSLFQKSLCTHSVIAFLTSQGQCIKTESPSWEWCVCSQVSGRVWGAVRKMVGNAWAETNSWLSLSHWASGLHPNRTLCILAGWINECPGLLRAWEVVYRCFCTQPLVGTAQLWTKALPLLPVQAGACCLSFWSLFPHL